MGLTRAEWEDAMRAEAQPEAPLPGRLVQLGVVAELRAEGEARLCVTDDGHGVLTVSGAHQAPAAARRALG